MVSYWTNFAARGDPNQLSGDQKSFPLPAWPRFEYGDDRGGELFTIVLLRYEVNRSGFRCDDAA